MDTLTDGDMDEAEFHQVLADLIRTLHKRIPEEYQAAIDNLLGTGEHEQAFERLLSTMRVYGPHIDGPEWLRIYRIADYLDIDVAAQLGVVPGREATQRRLSKLAATAGLVGTVSVKVVAKLYKKPDVPVDVTDLYDDIQQLDEQVLKAQYQLLVLRAWINPHLRVTDPDWFTAVPALIAGFRDRVPERYRDGFGEELDGGEYEMAVNGLVGMIDDYNIPFDHGEHQLLKRLLGVCDPEPETYRMLYDRCGCEKTTVDFR